MRHDKSDPGASYGFVQRIIKTKRTVTDSIQIESARRNNNNATFDHESNIFDTDYRQNWHSGHTDLDESGEKPVRNSEITNRLPRYYMQFSKAATCNQHATSIGSHRIRTKCAAGNPKSNEAHALGFTQIRLFQLRKSVHSAHHSSKVRRTMRTTTAP